MGVVLEALTTFCQTTSIKGLPRMIKANCVSLRIMWALCVLFGSAVALYQIIYIMTEYFTYETSTSIEELEGTSTIFPDVTVCKTNPPPVLSEDEGMGAQTLTQYLDTIDRMMDDSTADEKDLLEGLHSLEGYFRTIKDDHVNTSMSKGFTVSCIFRYRNGEDVNCHTDNSSTLRFLTPIYPLCMSFKPPSFYDRSLIQSMSAIFYLNDFNPTLMPNFGSGAYYPQTAGVAVFTHAPNTAPNLLTALIGSPGQETAIRVLDVRRLRENDPYSDCTGATYDKIDELSDFSYTESTCRHNCTQQRVLDDCHCLDPRVPTSSIQRKQHKFCGALKTNKDAIIEELECLYNHTDSRNIECDNHCVERCSSLSFEYHAMSGIWPHETQQLAFYNKYIQGKNYPPDFNIYEDIKWEFLRDPKRGYEKLQNTSLLRRNFLKVMVYFDGSSVVQYRDNPVHTPSSVSGSLGGILNLWIGISFVTAIEIAELFYNLFKRMLNGAPNTEEEETPPTLDQRESTRV